MPSRDRRLNPDLERALPADSDSDPPGYRRGRELREMLSGAGEWHPVTVRAWWRDRQGAARWFRPSGPLAASVWTESYSRDPERDSEA